MHDPNTWDQIKTLDPAMILDDEVRDALQWSLKRERLTSVDLDAEFPELAKRAHEPEALPSLAYLIERLTDYTATAA